MLLSALTDEELLRHAEIEHDALTASILETELLKRFTFRADARPLLAVLEEYGFEDPESLKEALEQPGDFDGKPIGELVVRKFDIDTPEALRAAFERLERFDVALKDFPLDTLNELAATA